MTDRTTAYCLALLAQRKQDNEPSLPLKPTMSDWRKEQLMYEEALKDKMNKIGGLPGCGSPTTRGMWSSLTNVNNTTFIGGVDPIERGMPQKKKLLLLI